MILPRLSEVNFACLVTRFATRKRSAATGRRRASRDLTRGDQICRPGGSRPTSGGDDNESARRKTRELLGRQQSGFDQLVYRLAHRHYRRVDAPLQGELIGGRLLVRQSDDRSSPAVLC